MAFVKLQTDFINSTTWIDPDVARMWVACLCLARPHVYEAEEMSVPWGADPGGVAAPVGELVGLIYSTPEAVIAASMLPGPDGMRALMILASEEPASRNPRFGGRRLLKVQGGFVLPRYGEFREADTTALQRQKRYRERKRLRDVTRDNTSRPVVTTYSVTHAEADAEAEVELPVLPPSPQNLPLPAPEGGSKGELTPPAKAKKARRGPLGHFVPDDFRVAEPLQAWAKENHPGVDLFVETKKFRSHEFDKPKSDWGRAWQNWIRRADEQRR